MKLERRWVAMDCILYIVMKIVGGTGWQWRPRANAYVVVETDVVQREIMSLLLCDLCQTGEIWSLFLLQYGVFYISSDFSRDVDLYCVPFRLPMVTRACKIFGKIRRNNGHDEIIDSSCQLGRIQIYARKQRTFLPLKQLKSSGKSIKPSSTIIWSLQGSWCARLDELFLSTLYHPTHDILGRRSKSSRWWLYLTFFLFRA